MAITQRITPCLWFADQGEQAAEYYIGIFPNSRIVKISRYSEAGHEVHRMPAGSVLTVDFELDGQRFTALNGGPVFTFNEAISFQIDCEDQAEMDYYWDRLTAGGDPNAQQCGWLKDRFGVSWQIAPTRLADMMSDPDQEKSDRVMNALLKMKKLDLAELERAYRG